MQVPCHKNHVLWLRFLVPPHVIENTGERLFQVGSHGRHSKDRRIRRHEKNCEYRTAGRPELPPLQVSHPGQWEDVHWEKRLYFNPYGKSRKARRWIPISWRAVDALKNRLQKQTIRATARRVKRCGSPEPCEWIFPSRRAESGHVTTVTNQFRVARRLVGLPETLKLYGARHSFATFAVEATGNVFAVADVMGHEDLKTTRIYQHPELHAIRDAIDQRNRRVM